MFDAEFKGLSAARSAFARAQKNLDSIQRDNVVFLAATLEAEAKRNFEGAHRKGQPRVPNSSMRPNIVTGTLRRSIRSSALMHWERGGWVKEVGPSTVYGRRVELGFTGTDARGRKYNQPAYPYFGPAAKHVREMAESRMNSTLTPGALFS